MAKSTKMRGAGKIGIAVACGAFISDRLSKRRQSEDRSSERSETSGERHDRHCDEREDLVVRGKYSREADYKGESIYLLRSGKWVYEDGEVAHPRNGPMRPPQAMSQVQPQPYYGPAPTQISPYPMVPYQQPTYGTLQARPTTWHGPPNAGMLSRPPPPTGLAASYYDGSDVSTPPLRRSRPAHGRRRSSSTDASYF